MQSAAVILDPAVARLLERRRALREAIARAHVELETLLQVVRPNLLALYEAELGQWKLRELELELHVARLRRTISLVLAERAADRTVEWGAIEEQLDEELRTFRARVEEAAQAFEAAQRHLSAPRLSADDDKALKQTYRALVIGLHPDLHPAQGERERALWHRVQAAWEGGDREALEILLTLVSDDDAPDATPGRQELLEAEVSKLEGLLTVVSRKIVELQSEPPFNLESLLHDETWLEAQRHESEARSESLGARAVFLERELARLQDEAPDDARHLAH
jgi:hypothetical protein